LVNEAVVVAKVRVSVADWVAVTTGEGVWVNETVADPVADLVPEWVYDTVALGVNEPVADSVDDLVKD